MDTRSHHKLTLCAGMGQYRAASLVLEEGCKLDPLDGPMRLQLEAATQGILRDLLEGKFVKHLTCPPPQPAPVLECAVATIPTVVHVIPGEHLQLSKSCASHEARSYRMACRPGDSWQ